LHHNKKIVVGRSSLFFNICSGFEEPLALDISFIHNINPSQLDPTNAVNAVMPYNTTIPHGVPSAPQSSSSIRTSQLILPAQAASPLYPLNTAYFFLFCSRNKTCLRTTTSESAKSPHFAPPRKGMGRAVNVPTGSYFSMLSGRCTRGRVSVL
jgi:hypothetical protein